MSANRRNAAASRRITARRLLAVALVCCLFPARAPAQDDAEAPESESKEEASESAEQAVDDPSESSNQRSSLFSLNRFDMYYESEYRYRYGRTDVDGGTGSARRFSQANREWGYESQIGFDLSGAILDPRLITFGGTMSFGLTHDRFEEFGTVPTRRDTDDGFLTEYDMRAEFFPGKKLSGSIYGRRRDDRINRRFQPTLDQTVTGFGTYWSFAHETFPMEISYDFLETSRSGNRDKFDDENFIESTFHYGANWLISEHHTFRLTYDHSEINQEYAGLPYEFETQRDLFVLNHELQFGKDHRNVLQTVVHWQEESGDFARDLFEIGPRLTLHHSDTLQTYYQFQFNREKYAGYDVESQRFDWQLVHQLYDNLTTTVNAFALYEDIEDDINTTQWGGSVDWQYNKKNKLGRFTANLALAYDTERVTGDDGVRITLDESHTMRDPFAVTLRNRNVREWTIVVTDSTNRRIYRPGQDYLVVRHGNGTQIRRMPNGNIHEGSSILVDYQYETPTNGQLDTMRVDFRMEQKFDNGLTPYYRLSYRNQEDDISTGFIRRADRTNHHRIGVTYEKKKFTLGLEYEVFDDSVDPFNAFHANGLLRIIQTDRHNLDLSGRFSRIDFTNNFDDRNVSLIDLELDHRWKISDALSSIERVSYRHEEDSIAGTTKGWDVSVGLQYAIGDLFAELTLDYDRLDLPFSDDEDFGVYVRVRRDFRDVFAAR